MVTIKLKHSSISGAAPSTAQLTHGELAINTKDGILFFKDANNEVVSVGNIPIKSINGSDLRSPGDIDVAEVGVLETKSDLVHTHSADFIESKTDKNLITLDLKSSISSGSAVSQEAGLFLTEIEAQASTAMGKVKLDADSDSKLLIDIIDNDTLIVQGGKLAINKIQGQTIPSSLLDSIIGTTSNIQEQLDLIPNLFKLRTAVNTYSDLISLDVGTMSSGDLVIVASDENNEDKTAIYAFDGTAMVFAGLFRAAVQRDFTKEPINLSSEVTGTISLDKIGLQSAVQTPIQDSQNLFVADNVEAAMFEIKQSLGNTPSNFSQQIGLEGISTFDDMVQSLQAIRTNVKETLLNKNAAIPANMKLSDVPNIIKTIKKNKLNNIKHHVFTTTENSQSVDLDTNWETIDDINVTLIRLTDASSQTIIDKPFTNLVGYTADMTKLAIYANSLQVISTVEVIDLGLNSGGYKTTITNMPSGMIL